jgi:hypothetical protein
MTKVISLAKAFVLTLQYMKVSPILSVREQEVMASLIVVTGLFWAAYVATSDYYVGFGALEFTFGPTDICSLGIFVWLAARWRAVHHGAAAVERGVHN